MARSFFTSPSHGVDVEVDLSSQVLEVEATNPDAFQVASMRPTLPGLAGRWDWAPAMAFAMKAKAFDDGLYAAVEFLAQAGTPLFPGKRHLLKEVHRVLRARWQPTSEDPLKSALLLVHAALSMTGTVEESDRKLRLLGMQAVKEFESNEGASKPLGFYTWNARLQGVFKQDRLLQTELGPDVAQTLLAALQSDERLLSTWRKHLALPARLTNPLAKPALDEDGRYRCFLPPSDSHEGQLVKKLFAAEAPPEGFQLVDELIARLQKRQLDSTPTAKSGWYDHQFHALVPLLFPERTPEADRLRVGPRYRAELNAQFRALFATTRETHIKQLGVAVGAAPGSIPPLTLRPRLSIEPLAEFYRRRAESYLFVRQVLGELFGAHVLADARRVLPTGVSEEPLLEELLWMEQLFRGAHAIVRQELGFGEVEQGVLPTVLHTRRWLRHWTKDPDLSRDPRCVVPLFFDAGRQRTKVTAVLGFQATPVFVRFLKEPQVRLHAADAKVAASQPFTFGFSGYTTVRPVSAELYVSRVPDRDEFQALCGKHVSVPAILEALGR